MNVICIILFKGPFFPLNDQWVMVKWVGESESSILNRNKNKIYGKKESTVK